jgi:phosphoribosylamine-glycine ligase
MKHSASWSAATFGPDTEVYLTVVTLPATGETVTLWVRLANVGTATLTGYSLEFTAPNTIKYFRWDNAVATQLGASVTQALNANDVLGLAIVGSILTGYVNGMALTTQSDPTYTAAGTIGIGGTGTTFRLDNVGGGTFIPPVAGTSGGGYRRKPQIASPGYYAKGKTHFEDGKPVVGEPTPVARPEAPEPAPAAAPTPVTPPPSLPPRPVIAAAPPPVEPLPPLPVAGIAQWEIRAAQAKAEAARRAAIPPTPPPPPPEPRRLILVTEQWGGLGLALLAQRQGSHVVCAYDYTHVHQDELAATRRCGDGLVEKVRLDDAMQRFVGHQAVWLFDANDFPSQADALRRQGELVIGTTAIARQVEDDRHFAAELAQSLGFALPETEEFHDYPSAVRYLQVHADQAFCYKPDKQDPTATYVPQGDDPGKANAELQEYLGHLHGSHAPSFVLQEVVNGIEVNFDLWLSMGQPIAAFCDLESKRKLVGDLGGNVGCAGDYVFPLPLDTLGVQATAAKYVGEPQLRTYTGTVDANIMLVEGKPYFLENCFRFGYNAYPVMFQALATAPLEEILRAWIRGDPQVSQAFHQEVGGSLSLVVDQPTRGTPILIPPDLEDAVYLYRAYQEDGSLALVDGWPEVATVVARAPSIPEAGQRCLAIANEIGIPAKGYRVDLAGTSLPTLPLSRYLALQELGWLPVADDDEAAICALLGVT